MITSHRADVLALQETVRQRRDLASRYGAFLLARLSTDRALATTFHTDDCPLLHRLEYLRDALCDCSAEEALTERVDATLAAVHHLMLSSSPNVLPVLQALAAPYADHHDHPARQTAGGAA